MTPVDGPMTPAGRSRALVTGASRGIGAEIARELARDGWEVTVAARDLSQAQLVAEEIAGSALALDVADHDMVRQALAHAGNFDLLVANAAHTEGHYPEPSWELDPGDWWQVYEVNVLGVHLCCQAVIPGMLDRRSGRIVITGSGAAFLPAGQSTAYAPSKAAACRYAEMLANELAGRIPVFCFDPGLVRTQLTADLPDTLGYVSPHFAGELVCHLATGKYDALSGRFIHAVDDDLDDLLARIDQIRADDLHAIRLRR